MELWDAIMGDLVMLDDKEYTYDTEDDNSVMGLVNIVRYRQQIYSLFIIMSILMAILTFIITVNTSLKSDVEYYEEKVSSQSQSLFDSNTLAIKAITNLEVSYDKAEELLTNGILSKEIFNSIFPSSIQEYMNDTDGVDIIPVVISEIITAYKNRSDSPELYDYYDGQTLRLTAFVKTLPTKSGETYTFRVDDRNMKSLIGSTIRMVTDLSDGEIESLESLSKGDEIIIVGVADTKGLVFSMDDCTIEFNKD